MAIAQTDQPTLKKPLRLWPGVLAAVLLLLVRFVVPAVVPGAQVFGLQAIAAGFFGSVLVALAIVVWWLFFSRAPWSERLGAVILMIIALFATSRLVHESIAGDGTGIMLCLLAVPVQAIALVAWAVASRRLSAGLRRASMVAAILLATGLFTLVRTAGVTGDMVSEFHWRWTPTPEQRLLGQAADGPAAPSVTPSTPRTEPATPVAIETKADWPGFRGPDRDSIIHGVRIETDWSASPPVELWRRPIGPGWSSFAVRGELLYTQEQRGDDEVVACYKVTTGEPVWRHRDAARFWESAGGAGPRGTPTLGNGRVYTFGATGILNALDARDGAVVWSRNVVADTGAKVPGWGFASSPLVVGDVVIVAAASQLVAYDLASGNPRWNGPVRGGSFSSPHLLTIDGVAQVLLMGRDGATSVVPSDGTLLWAHPWSGLPIVQPALVAGGDVLISTAGNMRALGMRRIAVTHGTGGWTVEERWTSNGLKPYFNDFVVHKGHAYGFDGFILSCIDVEDGKRMWKGGRYGHGQLLLLPDQDLLLVLSEEGELALVSATPDQFTELARFPAIEGKTWNHPVLVGDVLLIRNGQEMAAFQLSLAGG
jgi:outer membrane protein assembly factor BamB